MTNHFIFPQDILLFHNVTSAAAFAAALPFEASILLFPPLHCKPEPSGGEPHKLLSFVSAAPPSLSAACLHATTTH